VFVIRDGVRLETRAWGPEGAPAVLLMHGNMASARWWSFLAPLLARQRRVVAFSFSGMGLSERRAPELYTLDSFYADALAVAEHYRIFDAPEKPAFVGHSAGGGPTAAAANRVGERLAGAIFVDSSFKPPEEAGPREPSTRINQVYPDLTAGLARYRFAPPQPCENLYIVDFIARAALGPTEGGVTWRFDPALWRQVRPADAWHDLQVARCPLAFINGAKSTLTTPPVVARIHSVVPFGTPFIEIPEAYHHVMADQPLALISALEALLSQWVPLSPPQTPGGHQAQEQDP